MQIHSFVNNIQNKQVKKIVIDGFDDNSNLSAESSIAHNKALSLARTAMVSRLIIQEDQQLASLISTFAHGTPNNNENNHSGIISTYPRVEMRAFFDDQPESKQPLIALPPSTSDLVTLSMRKIDIEEAFEMLSKKERVNIVLDKGVSGIISINLFNVTLDSAIHAIAESAGFSVEKRTIGYVVFIKEDVVEKEVIPEVITTIRTYNIQYAEADNVESILTKHLSKHGKVTSLIDRSMVVIEDIPENFSKLESVIKEIDKEPRQILIEAKILEISLDETESFGLDWWKIFTKSDKVLGIEDDGTGTVGAKGLTNSTTGLIFNLVNDNINITLNALNEKGRVKTLSTPKLLTLERQEASVIIGDRKGYKLTTTIDQVTSESIEFLESGIILNVTPSVDNQGRILLEIHPEVSSGSVTGGIPSQTTTEVTTSLLADDGQTIFIGGLLKKKSDYSKDGVPVLVLTGGLF